MSVLIRSSGMCWGQGMPSLDGLDYETRSSIQIACMIEKTQGPAAYARCLNSQLATLSNSSGIPNLSGLDYETRSSIQIACMIEKTQGPAAYALCIKGHLASIGIKLK